MGPVRVAVACIPADVHGVLVVGVRSGCGCRARMFDVLVCAHFAFIGRVCAYVRSFYLRVCVSPVSEDILASAVDVRAVGPLSC